MKPGFFAERVRSLPPYLFAEIDRVKRELRERGEEVLDLSIGDPDLPTPESIVERLREEAGKAEHHCYPAYAGSERFRRSVAAWCADRFGVHLDPDSEVLALIGSKEGLAHAPLAFLNPGEKSLVPDIAYPVYATATRFAGGESVLLPVTGENRYRPELKKAPAGSKLLFLNYPNNPTSATADLPFFEEAVAFARKHELLLCHDAAYSEVFFDGVEPPSVLQTEGSKEVAIEFHSLSKTFNMTGWRIGFAVGNREAIAALGKIKTNVDSGIFTAIQEAAMTGLSDWKALRDANNRIYGQRRNIVAEALKELGIRFDLPRATFYFWCEVPTKENSVEFCARVLRETGVLITPGIGFGPGGEGFFRISMTSPEVRLQEALRSLKKAL